MIWAKSDGAKIKITFTQPLIGDVTGNQNAFTVTVPEYDYVPNGSIRNVEKAVLSTRVVTDEKELILEMQPLQRFESATGDVTVSYNGAGTLMGLGGPVAAFTKSFSPSGLIAKPDQNDAEHIELVSAVIAAGLLQIYYFNTAEQDNGHIELMTATVTGTLTHVNDI